MMSLLLHSSADAKAAGGAVLPAPSASSTPLAKTAGDFSVAMTNATIRRAGQEGQSGAGTAAAMGGANNANGHSLAANSKNPSMGISLAWQRPAPAPLRDAMKAGASRSPMIDNQTGAQNRLKTLPVANLTPMRQSAPLEAKIAATEKQPLPSAAESDGGAKEYVKPETKNPAVADGGLGQPDSPPDAKTATPQGDAATQLVEVLRAPLPETDVTLVSPKAELAAEQNGPAGSTTQNSPAERVNTSKSDPSAVVADTASIAFARDSVSGQRFERASLSTATGAPSILTIPRPANSPPAKLSSAPDAKLGALEKPLLTSESEGHAETPVKLDSQIASNGAAAMGQAELPTEPGKLSATPDAELPALEKPLLISESKGDAETPVKLDSQIASNGAAAMGQGELPTDSGKLSAATDAEFAVLDKPLLTSESEGHAETPIKLDSQIASNGAAAMGQGELPTEPRKLSATPDIELAALEKPLLISESKGDAETPVKLDSQIASNGAGGMDHAEPPTEFGTPSPQLKAAAETAEVLLRLSGGAGVAINSSVSSGGTGVAISSAQMKLASEQNEFAQSTAQGLPPVRSSLPGAGTGPSDDAADKANQFLAVDFISDKSSEQLAVNGAAGVASGLDATQGVITNGIVSMTTLAARIEQVQSLVTREVAMIRQSGAGGLAVSLKVDSQTDLLLQLTNHNGQMDAAVRCERGDLASLNSHWGQLQESLARQNVHLLPLEDRSGSRVPPAGLERASAAGQDSNQQKPSKNYREPLGNAEETPQFRQRPASTPTVNKPQTRNAPPKRWESWA
jgi:hypothetical protein